MYPPIHKIVSVVIVLFFILFLGLIFLPIGILNPDFYQANKLMEGEGDYFAYKLYQSAEKNWPFLQINIDFRTKYKKALLAKEKYYANKPGIIIFLKDNISQDDITKVVNKIKEFNYINNVRYISKEEALRIYLDQYKNNPELTKLVTTDILPASIEVYLNDWEKQTEIDSLVKDEAIVSEVVVVQKLF